MCAGGRGRHLAGHRALRWSEEAVAVDGLGDHGIEIPTSSGAFPFARVARARNVLRSTLSAIGRTEPSALRKLHTPGCGEKKPLGLLFAWFGLLERMWQVVWTFAGR
jgi:hypothetical protein